jgi:hypothetical protein
MKARLADAARRAELQGVVPPSKEAITLIRRSLGFQVPAEILQQLDVLRSQYSEAFARVMENTRDAARKSYVKHQEELTLAVADSNRSVLREMTVWNLPEWLEEAEGKMKAAKGLCQRIGYQIHELLKPSFIAFAEGLEELALGIVEREYGEAVSLGLEVGWRPSSVERTLRRAALDFRDHAASNHAGASPPGSIISGLIDEHQAEGGSNG